MRVKSGVSLFAVVVWVAITSKPLVAAQESSTLSPDQSQTARPSPQQSEPDQATSDEAPYAKLSKQQLERLVAPIALYPDALVAQILAASTFPAQITDAEGWLQIHPGLYPSVLAPAPSRWGPSPAGLPAFPHCPLSLPSSAFPAD